MAPSTVAVPEAVSRSDRLAPLRAADWLSLGAAPTFAFMAVLTGVLGADEMMCSAASLTSALSGMVPMYVLMSAFHFAPWLKLLSHWQNDAHTPVLRVRPARSGRSQNDGAAMALERHLAAGEAESLWQGQNEQE
jgi:hypothetical protein